MNGRIDLRVIHTRSPFKHIWNGILTGPVGLGDHGARPKQDLVGILQDVLEAVLGHGDAHVAAFGAGRQVEGASEATRGRTLT